MPYDAEGNWAPMPRCEKTLDEMKAEIRAAKGETYTEKAGAMVYLARHAEPLVGRGGKESRLADKMQETIAVEWGRTTHMPQNPPLTKRGRQQAVDLGTSLIGKGITRIYCSPFLRCVQTAEQVSAVFNCPFQVELGLCEWLIKAWYPTDPQPQMCSTTINEVYPSCDGSYRQLVKDIQYPEDDEDMRNRLAASMKHIVRDGHGASGHNFGGVLVIGHASGIEHLAKALTLDDIDIPPTPFCSTTALRKQADGSWSVLGHESYKMITALDHNYLSQGHTLRAFQPQSVPLPGTTATSGLHADLAFLDGHQFGSGMSSMDGDGDGTLTRAEWMSQMSSNDLKQ